MQSHLKLCMLTISLQIFQKFRSNLPKYLAGSIKAKCKLIESLQSNATKNYTCIRTLLRKVILCSSMLCVSLLGVLYPFCWSLGAYSLHFLFIYLSFRKGGSTHDRRQQASSSGLSAGILAALLATFISIKYRRSEYYLYIEPNCKVLTIATIFLTKLPELIVLCVPMFVLLQEESLF